MTKTVEIWDKVFQINGINASQILDSNKWMKTNDVILVKEGEKVIEMNRPSTLKANLGLEGELTSLEIGQAYINYLEEQEKKSQKKQITIEEIQLQLEEEKANREQLEATVLEMLNMEGDVE